MRFFKWKIFGVTAVVCLVPIVLGIILWDKLPDRMAIHFNVYGVADNFASKRIVVFGIPLLMLAFQTFCCFVNDISYKGQKVEKRSEYVAKWIIPVITVVLYVITLGYGMGLAIDMRKTTAFIVGVLLVVTGSCLPQLNTFRKNETDDEKARKITRITKRGAVIFGILFMANIFLPPICTVISVGLLILCSVVYVVYGIISVRK